MAEKKKAVTIEKVYLVPLGKELLKAPRIKKAPRAISTIRSFVKKHTKAEEVKISQKISEHLFARNVKKPPRKIKIKVVGDENLVSVELFVEEKK
jgi:large subunit ribosomal protein L31e